MWFKVYFWQHEQLLDLMWVEEFNFWGMLMAVFQRAIFKCVIGAALFLTLSSSAYAVVIHLKLARAEPGRAVSSLQVTNFVDRKYKGEGRRLGFKKVKKEGFPDCYAVRIMTHAGELNIIKLNCK